MSFFRNKPEVVGPYSRLSLCNLNNEINAIILLIKVDVEASIKNSKILIFISEKIYFLTYAKTSVA